MPNECIDDMLLCDGKTIEPGSIYLYKRFCQYSKKRYGFTLNSHSLSVFTFHHCSAAEQQGDQELIPMDNNRHDPDTNEKRHSDNDTEQNIAPSDTNVTEATDESDINKSTTPSSKLI
eukprot:1148039_1